MRALFISGLSARPRHHHALRRAAAELNVELEPTVAPGESLHAALRRPFDVAIVFGGDGTVHRYLRRILRSNTPMLVVPTGSGNDFARAVGTGTFQRALHAWRHFLKHGDNIRTIDAGLITALDPAATPLRRYFCNVASAGLDSATNRRANRMPAWFRSHGGYVVSLLATLLRFRPLPITLASEAQTHSQRAWFAVAANAPSYGGGMRIAPRALLDDGLLDLVYVRATSVPFLLRFFPTVFSGSHLKLKPVEYHQAASARIESTPALEVFADGEYVCQTPVEIRCLPEALRVIVPPA